MELWGLDQRSRLLDWDGQAEGNAKLDDINSVLIERGYDCVNRH